MYGLMLLLGILMYLTMGPTFLEIIAIKDMGITAILLAISICLETVVSYSLLMKISEKIKNNSLKKILDAEK